MKFNSQSSRSSLRESEKALKPISPETRDPSKLRMLRSQNPDSQIKLENLIDSMGNKRLSKNAEEGFLFNHRNGDYSKEMTHQLETEEEEEGEAFQDGSSCAKEAFDLNRSSLTSSQPQSILKNTGNNQIFKTINTSRSSPIQPSNKKKVYFQIEVKKDLLFLPNLKLSQAKLTLKALKSKKLILEKVYEKEKKDNELMLKNKYIYLE